MKKARSSMFVRIAVALFLVGSLLAITAVPAAANVTAADVTVNPNTAGDVARYVITFATTASGTGDAGNVGSTDLVEDVDTITITFPSGTTLPDTIPANTVSVNGILANDVGLAGAAPAAPVVSVTTRELTITTPVNVGVGSAGAPSVSVVISQTAGIRNPAIASSTLNIKVATTKETTAVSSNAYAVVASIGISPTSGPRGTSVTVTGKGFAASRSVDVRNTTASGSPVIGSTTSDAAGVISFALTIPTLAANAPAGGNALDALDGAGNMTATVTFTVNPSLTLSPTSGNPGATVTLSGSAWPGSANITAASVGGVNVLATVTGPARSPAAGATAGTTVTTGSDGTTLTDSETSFTAAGVEVGDLVVNVTDGSAGNVTTVTNATNLAISGDLSGGTENDFDTAEVYRIVAKVTTSGGALTSVAGGSTDVKLVIPQNATAGDKTVSVTIGGTTATAVFTVVARPVTITPSSGNVGALVNLSGTGLTANGTIGGDSISFGGVTTTHGAITVGSDGSWVVTNVPVPDAAPTGAVTVAVTDGTRQAAGTFTVASRAVTLSPTSGIAGSTVVVSGTGYKRNGTVNIQQPVGTTRQTVTSAADGTFAAAIATTWIAAATSTTSYVIVAVDATTGTITANATFSVPGSAISVSPTSAQQGSQITVSGTGFATYATLTVLNIGATDARPVAGVTTDSVGSFSVSVTVPGTVAAGGTTVTVTAGGLTEVAPFTVTTAPTTVATSLSGLGTNLVRAWGFSATTQAWKMYDPAATAVSDLTELTKGQGYWLKVNTAQTLTVGVNSYSLSAGWNLIGWLGT